MSRPAPSRNLATSPRAPWAANSARIRASLGNLLKHGYFITSEMGSQLSRSRLYGTMPVIYMFLARSGKTIRDVSLVALDKEGKVHPQDEAGLQSNAKGVKIVYAGSDGQERTLVLFQDGPFG